MRHSLPVATQHDGETATSSTAVLEALRTPPPKERADAARNRGAVLEAAARLFAERGVEAITMDDVAATAGVGKGTVFRRFGDKSGLAAALLDARTGVLQKAVLYGPPPLGPGAPAVDRLTAFVDAYFSYLLEHLALLRISETTAPGARYRIGAYRFWHRHLTILLATLPDPESTAHTLLAALAAEHVAALLPDLGEERMRGCLIRLAQSVIAELEPHGDCAEDDGR
ncbi:TetR/AcrR family transcriptional regulator [Streptomyces krungchingensis]